MATANETDIDATFVRPALERMPDELGALVPFAHVDSIIANVAVLRSAKGAATVDEGTYVCLADRRVLGVVFETFGAVTDPCYSVRFASAADPLLARDVLPNGLSVFYAPAHEASQLIFPDELQRAYPGTDASNLYDEEPGANEREFSDDEQEQAYRRAMKDARRGSRAPSVMSNASTSTAHHHLDAPRDSFDYELDGADMYGSMDGSEMVDDAASVVAASVDGDAAPVRTVESYADIEAIAALKPDKPAEPIASTSSLPPRPPSPSAQSPLDAAHLPLKPAPAPRPTPGEYNRPADSGYGDQRGRGRGRGGQRGSRGRRGFDARGGGGGRGRGRDDNGGGRGRGRGGASFDDRGLPPPRRHPDAPSPSQSSWPQLPMPPPMPPPSSYGYGPPPPSLSAYDPRDPRGSPYGAGPPPQPPPPQQQYAQQPHLPPAPAPIYGYDPRAYPPPQQRGGGHVNPRFAAAYGQLPPPPPSPHDAYDPMSRR